MIASYIIKKPPFIFLYLFIEQASIVNLPGLQYPLPSGRKYNFVEKIFFVC